MDGFYFLSVYTEFLPRSKSASSTTSRMCIEDDEDEDDKWRIVRDTLL